MDPPPARLPPFISGLLSTNNSYAIHSPRTPPDLLFIVGRVDRFQSITSSRDF